MKTLLNLLEGWSARLFQTRETTFVLLFGLVLFGAMWTIGNLLAPILFSIVISYVMLGLEYRFHRLGLPKLPAFLLAYGLFLGVLVAIVLVVIPLLVRQIGDLAQAMPSMLEQIRTQLLHLMENAKTGDSLVKPEIWLENLLPSAAQGAKQISQAVLSSLGAGLTIGLYTIIVPILVFFIMRDHRTITHWLVGMLPGDTRLATSIWQQMDTMLSNYVRGKVIEIVLVWFASQVLFSALGLDYATLLAVLTGLSVVVPVVGAMAVTVPIAIVGLLQWGPDVHFWVLIVSYTVLQMVDGYILVPLIFSEAMKLHPLVIIVSVLIFGGLFGFWGAFLAIPLATLIKVLLESWPEPSRTDEQEQPAA